MTKEDRSEYKKLSKRMQNKCRQDKNNYVKAISREIEEHHQTSDTKDPYKKVQELTRKFKPKTMIIEDRDEKVMREDQAVLKR